MRMLKYHPPPGRLLAIACLCAASLFLAANPAGAGPLPPGSTIANDGLPTGAAAVLFDISVDYNILGLGNDTGTMREVVIKDAATGHLDFLYQVKVKTGDIGAVVMLSYKGFAVDASAVDAALENTKGTAFSPTTPKGGLFGPLPINRNADGSKVGFDFDGANFVSGASVVMIVRTDADAVTAGFVSVQDGGSENLMGFLAPASVPEPATMTLLGIGVAGMAGYGWRRRRTQKTPAPTLS